LRSSLRTSKDVLLEIADLHNVARAFACIMCYSVKVAFEISFGFKGMEVEASPYHRMLSFYREVSYCNGNVVI